MFFIRKWYYCFCYRRPHFWTELHRSWCGGALTSWEGHQQVGFAVRPPRGMCQTSEPGKLESTYITCIEYFRVSSLFPGNHLTNFNQSCCVDRYTLQKYESKELRLPEGAGLGHCLRAGSVVFSATPWPISTKVCVWLDTPLVGWLIRFLHSFNQYHKITNLG